MKSALSVESRSSKMIVGCCITSRSYLRPRGSPGATGGVTTITHFRWFTAGRRVKVHSTLSRAEWIQPGQRYTLQIHYNNAAAHEDVRDSSGVRIHHGPVEGPEVSMLTFGPLGFNIPANSTKTVDGWCRLPSDTTILYSFPHMHGTGSGFDAALLAGGDREEDTSIVRLDGWDFDSQYIYQTPTPLKAGDVVRTSCTFTNNTDDNVRFGPDTADEMCFNFAYVSPPAPVSFCNQNDPPIDYVYSPGECASPGVETRRSSGFYPVYRRRGPCP